MEPREAAKGKATAAAVGAGPGPARRQKTWTSSESRQSPSGVCVALLHSPRRRTDSSLSLKSCRTTLSSPNTAFRCPTTPCSPRAPLGAQPRLPPPTSSSAPCCTASPRRTPPRSAWSSRGSRAARTVQRLERRAERVLMLARRVLREIGSDSILDEKKVHNVVGVKSCNLPLVKRLAHSEENVRTSVISEKKDKLDGMIPTSAKIHRSKHSARRHCVSACRVRSNTNRKCSDEASLRRSTGSRTECASRSSGNLGESTRRRKSGSRRDGEKGHQCRDEERRVRCGESRWDSGKDESSNCRDSDSCRGSRRRRSRHAEENARSMEDESTSDASKKHTQGIHGTDAAPISAAVVFKNAVAPCISPGSMAPLIVGLCPTIRRVNDFVPPGSFPSAPDDLLGYATKAVTSDTSTSDIKSLSSFDPTSFAKYFCNPFKGSSNNDDPRSALHSPAVSSETNRLLSGSSVLSRQPPSSAGLAGSTNPFLTRSSTALHTDSSAKVRARSSSATRRSESSTSLESSSSTSSLAMTSLSENTSISSASSLLDYPDSSSTNSMARPNDNSSPLGRTSAVGGGSPNNSSKTRTTKNNECSESITMKSKTELDQNASLLRKTSSQALRCSSDDDNLRSASPRRGLSRIDEDDDTRKESDSSGMIQTEDSREQSPLRNPGKESRASLSSASSSSRSSQGMSMDTPLPLRFQAANDPVTPAPPLPPMQSSCPLQPPPLPPTHAAAAAAAAQLQEQQSLQGDLSSTETAIDTRHFEKLMRLQWRQMTNYQDDHPGWQRCQPRFKDGGTGRWSGWNRDWGGPWKPSAARYPRPRSSSNARRRNSSPVLCLSSPSSLSQRSRSSMRHARPGSATQPGHRPLRFARHARRPRSSSPQRSRSFDGSSNTLALYSSTVSSVLGAPSGERMGDRRDATCHQLAMADGSQPRHWHRSRASSRRPFLMSPRCYRACKSMCTGLEPLYIVCNLSRGSKIRSQQSMKTSSIASHLGMGGGGLPYMSCTFDQPGQPPELQVIPLQCTSQAPASFCLSPRSRVLVTSDKSESSRQGWMPRNQQTPQSHSEQTRALSWKKPHGARPQRKGWPDATQMHQMYQTHQKRQTPSAAQPNAASTAAAGSSSAAPASHPTAHADLAAQKGAQWRAQAQTQAQAQAPAQAQVQAQAQAQVQAQVQPQGLFHSQALSQRGVTRIRMASRGPHMLAPSKRPQGKYPFPSIAGQGKPPYCRTSRRPVFK